LLNIEILLDPERIGVSGSNADSADKLLLATCLTDELVGATARFGDQQLLADAAPPRTAPSTPPMAMPSPVLWRWPSLPAITPPRVAPATPPIAAPAAGLLQP